MKTITAAYACRKFSDLLDAVQRDGEEFLIERRGRAVARVVPIVPRGKRMTWGDFVKLMDGLPRADPGFARDVRRAHKEMNHLLGVERGARRPRRSR